MLRRATRARKVAPVSGLTLRRREAIQGYLLISPWIFGFLVFTLFPFVASLALSFTKFRPNPQYVGLTNYLTVFRTDPLFWTALRRTLFYAGIAVPFGIAGSLLCAVLLNQHLRGTTFCRTFFFLPSLTPLVASTMIWIWIFQPDFGLLNYLLGKVGIVGPGWLSSIEWALPSLVIMQLWGSIGGNRMIIFLAGLQGVPEELFDAAKIDGASSWQRFLHITLPMISPTMFFNLVLGLIGAMKAFGPSYIATSGGPAYATYFYVLHLYYQAFQYMNMGYASALAWIFFAIVLVFTLVQLRLSNRWVYYAGEVR